MIRLGHGTRPRATAAGIRGAGFVGWAVVVCAAVAFPVGAYGGDPVGLKGTARSPKVAFARDIRPILADKCFRCHGPDAKQRKGKLRLDNLRDATAPAASGSPAIVPGKPEESELYLRITAE